MSEKRQGDGMVCSALALVSSQVEITSLYPFVVKPEGLLEQSFIEIGLVDEETVTQFQACVAVLSPSSIRSRIYNSRIDAAKTIGAYGQYIQGLLDQT